MKYQKPQIVAKSDAKKSYVAGCPETYPQQDFCHFTNSSCMCGPLK